MRLRDICIVLSSCLLLAGCGAKKVATSSAPTEESPSWHTCLIQGAKGTITMANGSKMAANVTMQTVRDSMLVMSIMPLLGMEIIRIEATPLEVIGIDKLHGQYARATYAQLNRKLTPSLNWDVLQQLCTAELPTGDKRARVVYNFGADMIELVVDYPARKLDVPVRVQHQRLDKYAQIDVKQWLEDE